MFKRFMFILIVIVVYSTSKDFVIDTMRTEAIKNIIKD